MLSHYLTEQVWWSPCRSRECPDDEQLSLVLHECADHCLLQPSKNDTKDVRRVFLPIPSRPAAILCTTNVSCTSHELIVDTITLYPRLKLLVHNYCATVLCY